MFSALFSRFQPILDGENPDCRKAIVDGRGDITNYLGDFCCATAVKRSCHTCGTIVSQLWHNSRTAVARLISLKQESISLRERITVQGQRWLSRRKEWVRRQRARTERTTGGVCHFGISNRAQWRMDGRAIPYKYIEESAFLAPFILQHADISLYLQQNHLFINPLNLLYYEENSFWTRYDVRDGALCLLHQRT